MSLMKDLTPAILSAAVGIMAGYSTVSSADTVRVVSDVVHERNQDEMLEIEAVHAAMKYFIKSCRHMEQGYRSTVKNVSRMSAHEIAQILDASELAEFSAHVQEIRNVEILLKNAEVPEQFADLHLEARKALAKGRAWVVQLHEITLQSIGVPNVTPGRASADGLRALAEFSTKRLAELANA